MPRPIMNDSTSALITSSMGGILMVKYGSMPLSVPPDAAIDSPSVIAGNSALPVP